MVLTKSELIAALKHEVRILIHLAGKVDARSIDYRPTPKQRSTIELLRYLTVMGPELIRAANAGTFEGAAWGKAEAAAASLSFDETVAALAAQSEIYAGLIGAMSDADFRENVTIFGMTSSRGAFIVANVLSGCAAYRTQIFLYLKAAGRHELSTMNLWAGMDAPPAA